MAVSRLMLTLLGLAAAAAGAAELHGVRHHHTRPGYDCGIPRSDYQYRARSPSATAVSRIGILLRTNTRVADVLEPAPPPLRSEFRDEQVGHYLPGGRNEMHVERHVTTIEQAPHESPPYAEPTAEPQWNRLPSPWGENAGYNPPDLSRNGLTRQLYTESFTSQPPAPPPLRQSMIELYQLDQPRLQIDHCEISQVALQLWEVGWWVLSLRADQNRRPAEGEPAEYNPRLHLKRNEFNVRLRCLGAFRTEPTSAALAAGKPVLVELEVEPFWVQNGEPRYIRMGGCCPLVQEQFAEIDRVEIEFFYR